MSTIRRFQFLISKAQSTFHLPSDPEASPNEKMAPAESIKMSPAPVNRIPGYPDPRWTAECHPREREVTAEVDAYFLQHWPFPDEKARKKFVNAGFSRVTCFYFPRALDDRIHFPCRLLTVLFLIDGKSIPLILAHIKLKDPLWLTR